MYQNQAFTQRYTWPKAQQYAKNLELDRYHD